MKNIFLMILLFCGVAFGDAAENGKCVIDEKLESSFEQIPAWRNSYKVLENASVYTAPSEACKSNEVLKNGEKITALKLTTQENEEFMLAQVGKKEFFVKKQDVKFSAINFDFYFTLVSMVAVLILGRFIISRVKFLQDYNIPEPVVGGIVAAIAILIVYQSLSIEFKFNSSLKDPLMLAFFTSIGLSADFSSLKKGGKLLFVFLVIVSILLVFQNIVGVGISKMMGIDPLIGLLGGSITMSGGHGTGAAWADTFKAEPYLFSAATETAMACATFGLIMGGIIGGPVARFLIKKHNLKLPDRTEGGGDISGFETPQKERLITPISFVESLALISIALLLGNLASDFMRELVPQFNLPTFVYCLFIGVILRNVLQGLNIHQVFDREVSVLGNVSLSLFLAFAMMTINLWELVALALPIVVILTSQAIFMVLFAIFVTFRFCGKDYDAAVLSAGHCGFGLGATPTAMVNMQTVTSHYGPSHIAFIIVPLVGAFFIDIFNALVIQGFITALFGAAG